MEALPKLRFKRDNIKGQLTRLQTYYESLDLQNLSSQNITQLEYRCNKFESIYDEFDQIQTNIDFTLDNSEESNLQLVASELQTRVQFENAYFDLITNIKSTITDFYNNAQVNNEYNENGSVGVASIKSGSQISRAYSQSQVKLPTIKLPTFNGSYDRWLEFRDSFTALVDDNNSISQIQKFYYLRSSLEQEAAQLIESIEVSAINYDIAWSMLKERFENKKLLVHNYVRAFFDAPVLTRESHSELRKIYDTFTKNLRSLQTLGLPTSQWDILIIHILTSKFDNTTRRDWESYKIEGELPTMTDINIFLKNKCDMLEKLEFNKGDNKFGKQKRYKHRSSSHISTSENKKYSCYYCKAEHAIYHCNDFLKLDVNSRFKEVNRRKLCQNCLHPGHNVQQCKGSGCRKCKQKHNSMLHIDKVNEQNTSNKTNESTNITQLQTEPEAATSVVGHTINKNISQVLLSTALVNVTDKLGNVHTARVLLDQGSQSHFITEALCIKLGLKKIPTDCAITGVGQTMSEAEHETSLTIMSRINNFSINISCLVLGKITQQLPINSFDQSLLDLPKNIQLADPNFNVSSEIDILLGVSVFYRLMCMKQIRKREHPVLQKTKLGWVVGGNLCYSNRQNKVVSCHTIGCKQIDDGLTRFWELENCDMSKKATNNSDEFCESHFLKTYSRDGNGRFIVDIPFKNNVNELGSSKEQAINRFFYLEKRFAKNPSLKKDYSEFMTEYINLGHMTKLDKSQDDSLTYFLPHHAVIKNSSITTKTRVVFDGSAKSDSGLSLNDVQYSGPTIQSDLFSILLRFRQHTYVLSADISKMYRQVLVNPEHRNFQRIVWRSEPDHELDSYELNTVTYGTSSAPFLAVRCLYQLGLDNMTKYPKASQIIMQDFYIDDLLSGTNSSEELIQIQKDITSILLSGGCELRKWLSNQPNLTSQFLLNHNLETNILQLGEHEQNKTLGIMWNSNTDTIQYSIKNVDIPIQLTKRHILSVTGQIFDPLGLLGPVVIVAKLILQLLCKKK